MKIEKNNDNKLNNFHLGDINKERFVSFNFKYDRFINPF